MKLRRKVLDPPPEGMEYYATLIDPETNREVGVIFTNTPHPEGLEELLWSVRQDPTTWEVPEGFTVIDDPERGDES